MRKTVLRTLELLETEERAGQEAHQSSLAATAFLCWKVVFAHYLGALKPDDEDPGEAGGVLKSESCSGLFDTTDGGPTA